MKFPTDRTFYLLVSCCVEESRFDILQKVINQLSKQLKGIDRGMPITVFDNGSTHPGTRECLTETLPLQTYAAQTNKGYWSAIKWVLDNVDLTGYDFIHIIESDHLYYDFQRIGEAEAFLKTHPDVGSIRLQEYSVAEQHLYNKTLARADGRRYAWVSHVNSATGKAVELQETDTSQIYSSNFLTQLHSLNRLQPIIEVFNDLSKLERFSEPDFQRMYHELYPTVAILDGGIFHAKLGFTLDNPKALSGSWSHDVSRLGYKTTRQDTILSYSDSEVIRL